MYKSIVATITAAGLALASQTALALPNLYDTPPPDAASDSDDTRVVGSDSYVDEQGRTISYEVWIEDGVTYGDARVEDTRGNHVELWLEGDVIYYEGVLEGEPIAGELPTDLDVDTDQGLCVGWVALVCIGAVVILALVGTGSSGCAHEKEPGTGCVPKQEPGTTVPGGAGGVPEEPGGGHDPADGGSPK